MIPSNSLAAVYGIAADCAERQVLGPDVAIDIARVYTGDAADRIRAACREVVSALASDGDAAPLADEAGRLAAYAGIDRIAARRRVAQAVIESGEYPL